LQFDVRIDQQVEEYLKQVEQGYFEIEHSKALYLLARMTLHGESLAGGKPTLSKEQDTKMDRVQKYSRDAEIWHDSYWTQEMEIYEEVTGTSFKGSLEEFKVAPGNIKIPPSLFKKTFPSKPKEEEPTLVEEPLPDKENNRFAKLLDSVLRRAEQYAEMSKSYYHCRGRYLQDLLVGGAPHSEILDIHNKQQFEEWLRHQQREKYGIIYHSELIEMTDLKVNGEIATTAEQEKKLDRLGVLWNGAMKITQEIFLEQEKVIYEAVHGKKFEGTPDQMGEVLHYVQYPPPHSTRKVSLSS
ncbi:hypothetical protein PFISCL1PPCAC_7789, partial [Pristionchus fissidentatus]